MKSGARTAIAMLGGAAALVFAVGFGGGGIAADSTTTTTTHPSSGETPAPHKPAASEGLTGGAGPGGAGGHIATLTGCVVGLDC